MHKISTILMICLCSIISNAQNNYVKIFSDNYGILDICENPDSTISISGIGFDTIYNSGQPSDEGIIGVQFAKVDWFGNLIYRRVYGSLRDEMAGHICRVEENGNVNYIMSGQTWSFSPPSPAPPSYSQAYLVKVNSNGDTLWTRAVDYGGHVNYQDLTIATDSNYVYCGSNGAATLTKVNKTDGDTLWTRQYIQPISGSIGSTGLHLAPDSGFYMGGLVIPPAYNKSYFLLLKTDVVGMLQWCKAYGNNLKPMICWDMTVLSTQEVLLVGQTDVTLKSDFGVIKLNALGDTLWCYKYNFLPDQYDVGVSVMEDTDGNYLILGYTNDNTGASKLLKIDTAGNVLWAWRYKWNGGPHLKIKKAYDGGFWIASGVLVKLDSAGYGCTALAHPVSRKAFALNIETINLQMAGGAVACFRTPTIEFTDTASLTDYCIYLGQNDFTFTNKSVHMHPNPASTQLTVQLPNANTGYVTVAIYDVIGNILQAPARKEISNDSFTVDINHLSTGMYFIKVNHWVLRFVKQ
ncbi:MAG: T9SS type A sorting domain-containing protein [Bacteroidia bacterium]|nr:T9SS type A sorting domain-containing protein [Bacteroidia bacterium]